MKKSLTNAQVDELLKQIVPRLTSHLHFNTIVSRFRESLNWEPEKNDAEHLVHESLKRLEKAGIISVRSYPNTPLCYSIIKS